MTLGKYLNKHPLLFHPALKKGIDGVYGYASDEGARHGKEGTEPTTEEAEFAVAVCAAVCTLLARRHPEMTRLTVHKKHGTGGELTGADHQGRETGLTALPRILHRQHPQQKHANGLRARRRAFLRWCEGQGIGELGRVQPVHVAAYIEQLLPGNVASLGQAASRLHSHAV